MTPMADVVSPRRWLLLEVGIKVRELGGTALLAFEAAERGWGVLLGSETLRDRPELPRGVGIEKRLTPGGAWCEEGLVYVDAEEYARMRVDRDAYRMVDAYFAWGRQQAEDMTTAAGCDAGKMAITGNPRFDLLRRDVRGIFDDPVARIRERFAPFILINTRFGAFNGYNDPNVSLASLRRKGRVSTPEHEAKTGRLVAFQRDTLARFEELVATLSQRFPDAHVVIRPHPSERHDRWHATAARFPNVHTVFEGHAAEWILAAEVSIQCNCTTGVEAYLLDRPTIAYNPLRDTEFHMFLPNTLSVETADLDETVALVAKALGGDSLVTDVAAIAHRADVAARFVEGMDGPSACRRLLDALESMDLQEVPYRVPGWPSRARESAHGTLSAVKARVAAPRRRERQRFRQQRFPGMATREIEGLLSAAQRATGRFDRVTVRSVGRDTFAIYAC
jgi:surface carbohydrate biosynthesis protein